jgi:hypothetical protein
MKLFALSAMIEVLTGIILMISPTFLARILLGTDLAYSGEVVGRVAGFALLALGIACWPTTESSNRAARRGLLVYNALAGIFLIYLGVRGALVGPLLWPAAVLHATLAILIARVVVKK